MKKVLFVLVALIVGGARADNIVTSREYVDTLANTLQNTLPAKNTNTVLLNTATAGEVGAKPIYDSSAAFGTQTDALVTAGQFNTAVQNALDSEFVCIERQNGNGGCLLYEIRGATQKQILPAGYTQLEYLESTGTQWINTGIIGKSGISVESEILLAGPGHPHSCFLGNRSSGTGNGRFFPIIIVLDQQYWDPAVLNDYVVHSPKPENNQKYHIQFTSSNSGFSFVVDGQLVLAENVMVDNTNTMTMFACHEGTITGNSATGRIYFLKIIENNVLVRNFIPARRDSDNTLGMYDTVTGTFFTNRGTGEFIAGPVVSSNLYLPSGQ